MLPYLSIKCFDTDCLILIFLLNDIHYLWCTNVVNFKRKMRHFPRGFMIIVNYTIVDGDKWVDICFTHYAMLVANAIHSENSHRVSCYFLVSLRIVSSYDYPSTSELILGIIDKSVSYEYRIISNITIIKWGTTNREHIIWGILYVFFIRRWWW